MFDLMCRSLYFSIVLGICFLPTFTRAQQEISWTTILKFVAIQLFVTEIAKRFNCEPDDNKEPVQMMIGIDPSLLEHLEKKNADSSIK